MHQHSTDQDDFLDQWRRDHSYLGVTHSRNETRARLVLGLTIVMMAAEVAAGTVFHSMALIADGWHMASHAAALGIASIAYLYARRHATNQVYSFGTGKVGDLAGFSSALILTIIALLMAWESIGRLLVPVPIAYDEAIAIAAIGLVVNLVSALLLGGDHSHGGHDHAHHHAHDSHAAHAHQAHNHDDHGHDHGHGHDHDHHDHDRHNHDKDADQSGHSRDYNFRAVYVHILADAVTSLMAVLALTAGRFLGWSWLDPLMGLVGGAVILNWAWTLLGNTGRVLLDAEPSPGMNETIRRTVEADADNRVADLHVWRLGPGHLAAMLTVVTHYPQPPAYYKNLLADVTGLSHVTVEVEPCTVQHAPHAAA